MGAVLRIIQKKGGREKTIEMPTVVSIDYSIQSNLTEISTMIYGYKNNFCMDLGNTLRLNVKFERINPQPYSDGSDYPEVWSNGKWYRYLEECLDYWQNLGMDPKNPSVQTGGFRFEYTPDDLDLYPALAYNVFMVGNLNMTYKSVQKMQFTLPLVASRMIGKAEPVETVTLTLETDIEDTASTYSESYIVPKGFNVATPNCPESFYKYQPGKVFTGWKDSSGTEYVAGSSNVWTKNTTLRAMWKGAEYVYVYDSSEDVGKEISLIVPDGVTRAMAYIVGGGGGAGGANVAATGTDISGDRIFRPGGGGGAGQARELSERTVSPGDILTIYIGDGGTGGTNKTEDESPFSTNGGAGEDTYIRVNGVGWDGIAKGGDGGKASYNGGAGGQNYQAGGSYDDSILDGADGVTSSPNVDENIGKGGKGTEYKSGVGGKKSYYKHGGNGGGAAAFRYMFRDNKGNKYPDSGYYESIGGDGQDYSTDSYAEDGTLGGGGGSGHKSDSKRSGVGGHGAAIVVFYV